MLHFASYVALLSIELPYSVAYLERLLSSTDSSQVALATARALLDYAVIHAAGNIFNLIAAGMGKLGKEKTICPEI